MSGPASVPFAIAAVFVPGTALKILLALLALLCGLLASYGVWRTERIARNKAEAALQGRALEITVQEPAKTYLYAKGTDDECLVCVARKVTLIAPAEQRATAKLRLVARSAGRDESSVLAEANDYTRASLFARCKILFRLTPNPITLKAGDAYTGDLVFAIPPSGFVLDPSKVTIEAVEVRSGVVRSASLPVDNLSFEGQQPLLSDPYSDTNGYFQFPPSIEPTS